MQNSLLFSPRGCLTFRRISTMATTATTSAAAMSKYRQVQDHEVVARSSCGIVDSHRRRSPTDKPSKHFGLAKSQIPRRKRDEVRSISLLPPRLWNFRSFHSSLIVSLLPPFYAPPRITNPTSFSRNSLPLPSRPCVLLLDYRKLWIFLRKKKCNNTVRFVWNTLFNVQWINKSGKYTKDTNVTRYLYVNRLTIKITEDNVYVKLQNYICNSQIFSTLFLFLLHLW